MNKVMNIKTKKVLLISILSVLFVLLSVSCDEKENEKNNDEKTITDMDGKEIVKKLLENISELNSYYIETSGTTVAKKGIITYTQNTHSKTYKVDNSFFNEVVSNSLIVNQEHQVYVNDGFCTYRDSLSGELTKVPTNEYKEIYGKVPEDSRLFTYILNDETITESSVSGVDSNYILNLVIDPDKGTTDMRTQMVKFGGLSSEPLFTSIILNITIDKDFNILSFESREEYTIVKQIIGELTCVQELKSIFKVKDYESVDLSEFIK